MKTKTIIITVITVIIILITNYFVGSGFNERTDVALLDFTVSADGTEITFNTSLMSPIGFIRGFKNNGGGEKPHYLTFYSTFGGIHSSFGAKSEFTLTVDKDDNEIYFNRADGGYELVLKKNEKTGEWVEP